MIGIVFSCSVHVVYGAIVTDGSLAKDILKPQSNYEFSDRRVGRCSNILTPSAEQAKPRCYNAQYPITPILMHANATTLEQVIVEIRLGLTAATRVVLYHYN